MARSALGWVLKSLSSKSLNKWMVSHSRLCDRATYAKNSKFLPVGVSCRLIIIGPIIWPCDLMSIKGDPPIRVYRVQFIDILVPFFRMMVNVTEDGVIGICPLGTRNGRWSLWSWMQKRLGDQAKLVVIISTPSQFDHPKWAQYFEMAMKNLKEIQETVAKSKPNVPCLHFLDLKTGNVRFTHALWEKKVKVYDTYCACPLMALHYSPHRMMRRIWTTNTKTTLIQLIIS